MVGDGYGLSQCEADSRDPGHGTEATRAQPSPWGQAALLQPHVVVLHGTAHEGAPGLCAGSRDSVTGAPSSTSVQHGPRPQVYTDTLIRQAGHPKGSEATSKSVPLALSLASVELGPAS